MADDALRLDPSAIWIHTNRAHALLFLGRFAEAKAVYEKHAKTEIPGGKTFAQAVLDDFDSLARAGITHPDTDKIRRLLKP